MEQITRRGFLRRLAVGAAASVALIRSPWVAFPQEEEGTPEARFFTPQEWAAVEAGTARIFPSDDGPGAREESLVWGRGLRGEVADYIVEEGSKGNL